MANWRLSARNHDIKSPYTQQFSFKPSNRLSKQHYISYKGRLARSQQAMEHSLMMSLSNYTATHTALGHSFISPLTENTSCYSTINHACSLDPSYANLLIRCFLLNLQQVALSIGAFLDKDEEF